MGVVYLAREVALPNVAIKLLPPHRPQPDLRERFLREARTAAQLSQPNIVAIHTVDQVQGFVFFVMAYIDGDTLGDRVRTRGPLPPGESARVLREIAWALAYAHAQGIIHRDLKPDNIILERATGRAVLTDFGIARRLEATGLTGGASHGTPNTWPDMPRPCAHGRPISIPGHVGYSDSRGGCLRGTRAGSLVQPAGRSGAIVPPCAGHSTLAGPGGDALLEKRPDDRFPDAKGRRRALVARRRPGDPCAGARLVSTASRSRRGCPTSSAISLGPMLFVPLSPAQPRAIAVGKRSPRLPGRLVHRRAGRLAPSAHRGWCGRLRCGKPSWPVPAPDTTRKE